MQWLLNWWPEDKVARVSLTTLMALLLGAVMLLLFAAGQGTDGRTFWTSFAASFMTAAAAFVVGAFIGCLFGIPQSATATTGGEQSAAAVRAGLYRPSNQLQQVSDWLVKILLGASLTQLGNVTLIGTYFEKFVGSAAAAMVIITYFFVVGMLSGYFLMTVYLGRLIREAGEDLAGDLRRIEVEYELHKSLYGSPADQRRAIENAKAYLKENPKGSADIFGHLACAYGQWYDRAARNLPDATTRAADPELKQLRDTAVAYAKEAVDLDCEWGDILQNLYDARNPGENDWAIFSQEEYEPDQVVAKFLKGLRVPRNL